MLTDQAGGEVARFLEVARGFKLSKAFNVSVKLGLYSLLATTDEGLTSADIAEALHLHRGGGFRGLEDLLDLLVSIDCLQREGSGTTARYQNTPSSQKYLVRGQPDYIGGIMVVNDVRSYVLWEYLEDCLKLGSVPPQVYQRLPSAVEMFGGSKEQDTAAQFALGMQGLSLGPSRALAEKFDFSRYSSLGDFGGSTGCLSVCVCQRHSHMSATSYDLESVRAVAEEYVESHDVSNRVKVVNWDFFSDTPFPHHDVITMGMVLHDWGIDKKLLLMRKAYDALPEGGAFVAIEMLIDDDRRQSCWGLASSLNMMLEFGEEHSFDFTMAEFTQWATSIGFRTTEKIALQGAMSAAVAYK